MLLRILQVLCKCNQQTKIKEEDQYHQKHQHLLKVILHLNNLQGPEGFIIMARVDIVIPEPTPKYTEENQRQVTQSLRTMQDKLNTSYQQELKNEQDAFNYFLSWQLDIKTKVSNKLAQARLLFLLALLMRQL